MTELVIDIDRIWVDLETTGLDDQNDVILEVGLALGDVYGNVSAKFETLIWNPRWREILENAEDIVQNMHDKSNLTAELLLLEELPEERVKRRLAQVESQVVKWFHAHDLPERELKLAGSSVHFDRGFLKNWMPEFEGLMHYRNVDVSSIKETCRGLNPELYAKLQQVTKPKKLHRVGPDIEDTLEEYKFYVDNFLYW